MRKLDKSFKHKGFNFSQIKRINNKALYKKTSIKGTSISYEVIIISSHNGYELAGTYIEPAETYPSTSQWGTKGWTCVSLEEAEAKFNTI